MRVFAISDLHTDMRANMKWIQDLDSNIWKRDALIVAGDVSDRLEILIETMQILKSKFREVFFSCGNHDVWDPVDSLSKIDTVRDAMQSIGVRCEPTLVDSRVWIVPLESWHYFDKDQQANSPHLDLSKLSLWRDFDLCHWPSSIMGESPPSVEFDAKRKLRESLQVAQFLLERNDLVLERVCALQSIRHLPIISFSHFVPRFDLNPPVFARFQELACVTVCKDLDPQIRKLKSKIHIFGHTHIRSDRVIDGVRYIQFPLGYPAEGPYCPRFGDMTLNEIVF